MADQTAVDTQYQHDLDCDLRIVREEQLNKRALRIVADKIAGRQLRHDELVYVDAKSGHVKVQFTDACGVERGCILSEYGFYSWF